MCLAFLGPLQGRTEPLTCVMKSKEMSLGKAIDLRDQFNRSTVDNEHLTKNLKLQIPYLNSNNISEAEI